MIVTFGEIFSFTIHKTLLTLIKLEFYFPPFNSLRLTPSHPKTCFIKQDKLYPFKPSLLFTTPFLISFQPAMAFDKKAILVLLVVAFMASFQLSAAAVYNVGDATGWTTIGNYDYNKWASTKIFRVGDTIVFNYNPQYHNVMQVTHAQFKACNVSFPLVTLTTGNDSILIKKNGHDYFVCGIPGHCEAGQKVDIRVVATSSVPPATSSVPPSSSGAAISPAPGPSDGTTAPGPSPKSDARLPSKGSLEMIALAAAVFLGCVAF